MLRTIIVDDEESARDVLENLLKRFCPQVQIIAKCEDVLQAIECIKAEQPDLVFLDIEMPDYAGYEIVNFFEQVSFEIIFVTAYDKYALRAFEIAAVDYLLKPVEIERLKEAVSRVSTAIDMKHHAEKLHLLSQSLHDPEVKNIMVSEKGNHHVISVDSIVAIEAQESYCFIHTSVKKYTVSKNLKHFETILADHPHLIRVHKSWMVAKNYIENYSRSEMHIKLKNGITAKLSKYKKAEFEEALLK